MEEIITKKDGKKEIIYRKKTGMYKKHELVSSHNCRRSFATNIYGKIDTLTIMKITGHKTEVQFLNYIKITPKNMLKNSKPIGKIHLRFKTNIELSPEINP